MEASVGKLLLRRLCRRWLVMVTAVIMLLTFLYNTPGGSNVWWLTGRAPKDSTDCLTNINDYTSIDRMFDEIILEPKTILFWTKFYGSHDFGFGLGQNPFWDHKCRNANCIATSNQSAIAGADAVVFHWGDLLQTGVIPKMRKKSQVYVFFNMEPPQKMDPASHEKLRGYNGFFNYTMTYLRGSSILNPFNKFVKRTTPVPKVIEAAKTATAGKTKMVAWYSYCDEDPLGKSYLEELQKYIDVDTYGPCGKLQCGPIDSTTCWDLFEKEYYFFFAMESVMCKDYITERSFRPLNFNIVPVVFAGGNITNSMPPNSHINVLGFPNPKSLADFLKTISKDYGAYMWYMEWKQHLQYVGWGQGFCELCDAINTHRVRESIVWDLASFWSNDKCGKNFMEHFKSQWMGN